MQKVCQNCSQEFTCSEQDQHFYQKMAVPTPSLCPQCRMQRRLAFRNDRFLYKSTSSLSGKEIITMYHPDSEFTVYDQKEWWSEGWDPLKYGRDFDFTKGFFEQFAELQKAVPRFNVFNRDTENCEYVNYAPHCKNCYLLFGSWFNQDCFYGQTLNECKDCIDNLFLDKSELCYENVDCSSSYRSFFCQNSSNVTDSYFCFDCQNVQNCIGCWNLRGASFQIFNKPVSKEEFKKESAKFSSYNYLQKFKKRFAETIRKEAIHKSFVGTNNQNVSGNFIFQCKNAHHCFSAYRSEDISFCSRAFDQKDSYDFEGGGKGELTYEGMSNDFAYNSIGSMTCEHLHDSHYCDLCFNCKNCFGCVGLRYQEYCILNKRYSKDEYEKLLPKIIEDLKQKNEWGEFFPIKLSPFSYNETLAQEYFPLSKNEAIAKGYHWRIEKPPTETQIITVPDTIHEIDENILKEILICETCQKPFKIIKPEFIFYQKQNLAIPRLCPNCRHAERMNLRLPRKLWNRGCHQCSQPMKTSYSPERPERVYCEKCYLGIVY